MVLCKVKVFEDVAGVCETRCHEGLRVLSPPFGFKGVACAQPRDVLFPPGCPVMPATRVVEKWV